MEESIVFPRQPLKGFKPLGCDLMGDRGEPRPARLGAYKAAALKRSDVLINHLTGVAKDFAKQS